MIVVGHTKISPGATIRGKVVHIDEDRRVEVVRYMNDCMIQIWNGKISTRFLLTQEAAICLLDALGSALESWEDIGTTTPEVSA